MDLKETGVWGCGLDSFGSRKGSKAGPCEHGNEPSGFLKRRGIPWPVERLTTSQGLYPVELITDSLNNLTSLQLWFYLRQECETCTKRHSTPWRFSFSLKKSSGCAAPVALPTGSRLPITPYTWNYSAYPRQEVLWLSVPSLLMNLVGWRGNMFHFSRWTFSLF
jgi:hypothetical protein